MSDGYDYLRFLKRFKSYWAQEAAKAVLKAHQAVPEDASLGDRTKIIDAAYPFGERRYTPYKQWLRVRREYLTLFGYERKGTPKVGRVREEMPGLPIIYESPLERQKRRSMGASHGQ